MVNPAGARPTRRRCSRPRPASTPATRRSRPSGAMGTPRSSTSSGCGARSASTRSRRCRSRWPSTTSPSTCSACRARTSPPGIRMDLMLSTHDTGYERPDGPTIAKVLASLDGGRNVLATLATSDCSSIQASGSVQAGFGLDLQEGSIERRFRTRDRALPLAWVTEAFQRYARADLGWRGQVEWAQERIVVPRQSAADGWARYVALLLAGAGAMWLWHSWRALP